MESPEAPHTDSPFPLGSRVRHSFDAQPAMRLLGAELVSVEPGRVRLGLPFRDDLTQQNGFLHAGVVAGVLDSACGYAAFTLMPPGSNVLSIEFKLNLLAPARGERFEARAEVMRAGRTITVCTADLFALGADGERLVAAMQATMMRVPETSGPGS